MKRLIIILSFIYSHAVLGQITADFSFEDNACLNQNVEFVNQSTNASSYKWDFCESLLIENDEGVVNINNNSLFRSNAFQIARDTTVAVFFSSGSLRKVSFDGGVYSGSTTLQAISGSSGSFQGPNDIRIVKDNGQWIGFTANQSASIGVSRLFFGSSIGSSLQSFDFIPSIDPVYNTASLAIVNESAEKILFAGGNASGKFYVIDFENSFDGAAESFEYTLTGVSRVTGLTHYKIGAIHYVIGAALNEDKLIKLRFEDGLNNAPIQEEISIASYTLDNPYRTKYLVDRGTEYLLVLLFEGNIDVFKKENGTWIYDKSVITDASNLVTLSERFVEAGLSILGTSVQGSTAGLYRINYADNCIVEPKTSTEINPTISYSQPGTYPITLTSYHENGTKDAITKEISVTDNEVPAGNLVADTVLCIVNSLSPTFNSEDAISSYLWEFGDGSTSTDPAPIHSYASAGLFSLSLIVESPEGCSNTFSRDIAAYDEAAPDFQTAETEYCSFEAIPFENLTSDSYGDNISWLWDFGDGQTSTHATPEHSYEAAGNYTIRLTANVLGCETYIEKSLEIIDGPAVDFAIGAICLGEAISLTDQSKGDNISSYQWVVDEVAYSFTKDTSIVFSEAGTYTIRLTLNNAAGCENSQEKEITLYKQIISDIIFTEAIENLPFTSDVELIADQPYSIVEYDWELNGQTSTEPSPVWDVAEGTYELNLSVTVDQGCSFSFQKEVVVLASEQPTPDFTFDDNLCINEIIELQNASINASSFQWDFCLPILNSNQFAFENINANNLLQSNAFQIARDTTVAVFFSSGSLRKVSFDGGVYSGSTTLQAISGSSGSFQGPNDIRIVKDNGQWIGFTANQSASIGVSRLFFGSSIGSSLQSFDFIPSIDPVYNTASLAIVNESAEKILFAGGNASGKFYVIDFENSFDGAAESFEYTLTGVSRVTGLTHYKIGAIHYVIGAALNEDKLIKLRFEDGLNNAPIQEEISIASYTLDNPYRTKYLVDRGTEYLLVLLFEGNIDVFKKENGTWIYDKSVITDASNLVTLSERFVEAGLSILGTSVQGSTAGLYRINYADNCIVEPKTSTEINPTISYSQPGTYPITLTAFHPNGSSASLTKEITVTADQAPLLDILQDENLCVSNAKGFDTDVSSGTISSYAWDVNGDGILDSDTSFVEFQYDSAARYPIRLDVVADNGCSNFSLDTVTIYSPIQPDFRIDQTVFCTNDQLSFINQSTYDAPDSIVTWDWSFNGLTFSNTTADYQYIFPGGITTGTISLAGSIPGCETTYDTTITLSEGPFTLFDIPENICFGDTLIPDNFSTTSNVIDTLWTFGNGDSSTTFNPTYLYNQFGTFDVRLQLNSTNGCRNSFTLPVTIRANPIADFQHDLICDDTPVQFRNNSFSDDGNIVLQRWQFDNSTVIATDPFFQFTSPGATDVQLYVETNYGCADSTQNTLTILPSPEPVLSFDSLCLQTPAQFTFENQVEDQDLSNIIWDFNGSVVNNQNTVTRSFNTPGNYTLTLALQATNGCQTISTRELYVPQLPDVAYLLEDNCFSNEGNRLISLSAADPRDPVISHQWIIENNLYLDDSIFNYVFPEPGYYSTSLSVRTDNGCQSTIAQMVDLSPSPVADFTLDTYEAAAPLSLFPENRSTGEMLNFIWRADGDILSTLADPVITLDQSGIVPLSLTVVNDAGCLDSVIQTIRLVDPLLDAEIDELVFNDNGQVLARLINKGTIVLDASNTFYTLSLGNQASLSVDADTRLIPDDAIVVSPAVTLEPVQTRRLNYVCLSWWYSGNDTASILIDKECIPLDISTVAEPIIINNPFEESLDIQMIANLNYTDQRVIVYKNSGEIYRSFEFDYPQGLSVLQLPASDWEPGIYIIKIEISGDHYLMRAIKH